MDESKRTDESNVLRVFLTERDVDCPVCAYNLRNCQSTTCPECGARLDVRIGSTDLRLAPWLTAVITTAACIGPGVLVLILGIIEEITTPTRDWPFIGAFFLLSVFYGVILLLLIRRRRKYWRMPRVRQWRVGLFISAIDIVILIAVIELIDSL